MLGISNRAIGPLWDRSICNDMRKAQRNTSPFNSNAGSRSLKFVSGHTVQELGYVIKEKVHGRVWCVDTGMSRAFKKSENDITLYEYHRQRAQSLQIKKIKTENFTVKILKPPKQGRMALKVCFSQFIPNVHNEFIGDPQLVYNGETMKFGRNTYYNPFFNWLMEVSREHFRLKVNFPLITITDLSRHGTYTKTDFNDETPEKKLIQNVETPINVNTYIVLHGDKTINGIRLNYVGKLMWVVEN